MKRKPDPMFRKSKENTQNQQDKHTYVVPDKTGEVLSAAEEFLRKHGYEGKKYSFDDLPD